MNFNWTLCSEDLWCKTHFYLNYYLTRNTEKKQAHQSDALIQGSGASSNSGSPDLLLKPLILQNPTGVVLQYLLFSPTLPHWNHYHLPTNEFEFGVCLKDTLF